MIRTSFPARKPDRFRLPGDYTRGAKISTHRQPTPNLEGGSHEHVHHEGRHGNLLQGLGAPGPVVTFSHGWPLCADAWEAQMLFLASKGYRCIAHDRRGHGRSSQPWHGNEMDTYSDDLAQLFDFLDLKGATMIGHSTGGGEVARYIGRHGSARVAKAVLGQLRAPADGEDAGQPGRPADRGSSTASAPGSLANRAQLYKDFRLRAVLRLQPARARSRRRAMIDTFWMQGMMAGHKGTYDCIKAFSETDFTEDLKKFDVPTLVIHGDDDQIVPIGAAALQSYETGQGRHAEDLSRRRARPLTDTAKDQLNADLLAFIKS